MNSNLNAEKIVFDYAKQGIRLWVENDKLKYLVAKNCIYNNEMILKKLKENKEEIISFLMSENCFEVAYPTSYEQRSLWFLDTIDKIGPAYNIFTAIEIDPTIDLIKLKTSILKVLSRHDILKTVYFMQFGCLWQKIISNDIFLEMINDVEYISEIDDSLFKDKLEEIAKKRFDLKEGPVVNCKIIQRNVSGLDRYYFVFCVHHIVADFNSLQILQKEITECYFGKDLHSVENNYFETIDIFENEVIYSDSMKFQLENLSKLPEIPDLGWKHTLSKSNSYMNLSWELDSKTSTYLRKISEKTGVTIFSIIFSIYAISIAKLSNNKRILINLATTVTNRNNNFVVGNFSNLVPFIIDVDDNDSYKLFFEKVFNKILLSENYRNIPFSLLIEKMGLSNVDFRSPLTPLTFAWHSGQIKNILKLGNTYSESRQIGSSGDLMLTARDINGVIDFKLCGNDNKVTKIMLLSLKQKILDCIGDVTLDLEKKITEVNNKALNFNEKINEKKSYDFFDKLESYSIEGESKIAIKANNNEISYGDLLSKAKKISGILNFGGVGFGDKVVVHLDKNINLVPFILGVILSGATYVPLDLNLPADRIKTICDEAKPKLVISDEEDFNFLNISKKSTNSFEDCESIKYIKNNLENTVSYIIYTSGSTGIPKGVPITFEALNIFLNNLNSKICLNSETNFLSISSISFDASIAEIFLPLFSGAKLILSNSHHARNPEKINQLIQENDINALQATPTTWNSLLIRYPKKTWNLDAYSMGEALPTKLAQKLIKSVNSLWNLYGPTEATVYVTADKFDPLDEVQNSSDFIPIKNIFDSSNLYILDQNNMPISSIGGVGELCITGSQLSSGYLNSNNQSFLSITLEHSGKKIKVYKTGDLARYNLDNYIDIIGRLDNQIKIKGYRVELGEIEAVIRSHPSIENCSVIYTEVINPKILAVVVGQEIEIEILKKYLASKLPLYMLPTEIRIIPSLPVNNNGKVDKKAIMSYFEVGEVELIVDNKNNKKTEDNLICIISKIMGRVVDDKYSNLFSLGLDSLQSVTLKMDILNEFGVNLSMEEIYNFSTINDLSNLIDSKINKISYENHYSFESDMELPNVVIPLNVPEKIENVLLTGATGYLGSRVLKELINKPNIVIHCLVRSADCDQAKHRVLKVLGDKYDLSKLKNVYFINGFLGASNFGMQFDEYIALSQKIDSVIHCAALVNFTLPYSVMRENIVSTKQIIEFSCLSKLKYLNFISTYSVLNPKLNKISETFFTEKHEFINFGYAESKWVCEQLLLKAKLMGLPCKIFRPSRIISDINSNDLNLKDFYSVVLAGAIVSGYAPIETGVDNFVDVNKVSSVIVEESINQKNSNSIIHLCGKKWTAWDNIIKLLEVSAKKEFKKIPYTDWVELVYKLSHEHSSLYPFKEIYPFLIGMANSLREVFKNYHPIIDVNLNNDIDVIFTNELITKHYTQICKFHSA
ncbi:AMP-binding protein [Acinetobacter calcoaceticus]|uniref:AMP-binding protein n=1 Tax=Acinetobacter calcoaceticus TaxID=471 RepID=UPI00300A56A4